MESNSGPRSDSSGNSTQRSERGPTPRPARKRAAADGGGRGRAVRPREQDGAAVSAAKREQRERRLESQRHAYRMRAAAAATLVLVLVVGCVSLYRSSAFTVRNVEVVGARQTKADAVRKIAAVPRDATLLRLPSSEIHDRLVAYPWVAAATVERRFPDTVRLTITEREPVALVDAGGGLWLADASGFVIAKGPKETTSTMAVVRDVKGFVAKAGVASSSETLLNALRVLGGISKELRSEVRTVSAPSVDETGLMTKDGVEVLIGSAEELGKKDLIVRKILAEQRGKVVFVDVRTTSRPVSRGLGE
jgi:cell division protein FtsQ